MIKLNINIPFSVWHRLLWPDESGIHSNSSYWLQVSWHQNHPSSIKFYWTYIRKKKYRKITKKKTIQSWTEKQVEKHFFFKNIKIKKIILWFRICSITRTHQYIWVIAWCTELFERTRSPWRKTKVWQFWVLIWAEATLCTDLQPPRWSPQSEIVLNTELSGSCCRRLASLLLSSSLRAGSKKTFRVGLQVCIIDFAFSMSPLDSDSVDISPLDRIRKQSFSRQGRGGEAPLDSGFW